MVRFLLILSLFFMSCFSAFAAGNTASSDFSITLPAFVRVESISSPVLVANITDRTGNLRAPLSSTFRVISNGAETKTLYLNAHTVTQGGYEPAMFEQGGRVYIAFANLAKMPQSQALANCKIGGMPKDSPGIVAFPVDTISGAKYKYLSSKNKYEVYAENGTTYVTVHIGQNVLRSSFAANDPRGFYQAVLSLTEADI